MLGKSYALNMPEGKTPAESFRIRVSFELADRRATKVRFVVRDDANGRVGSSEIVVGAK